MITARLPGTGSLPCCGCAVSSGGEFFVPRGGICRGNALSPLFSDSFLWYVDSAFCRQEDIYYIRYMDDFLFLSARHWSLRRAVRRLHDYFEDTGFECHPDKTQIGRIERGFDWLGVWFDATDPSGRKKTIVCAGCGLRSRPADRDCQKRQSVSGCNSMKHDGGCGQRGN